MGETTTRVRSNFVLNNHPPPFSGVAHTLALELWMSILHNVRLNVVCVVFGVSPLKFLPDGSSLPEDGKRCESQPRLN